MTVYQKILLTGVHGQVGHALQKTFFTGAMIADSASTESALAGRIISLDRSQLDLTNQIAIREAVQVIKPDLIINPAAYTAVDKAETEPELAYAINALAPQILAEEAAKLGAKLVHFSTDYVYAGTKTGAYLEEDVTQPLSIYGKSKLAGEEAIRAVGGQHLIFRTSWVYGAYGKNFLNTILRLAGERDALRIVADQFGAPTSSTSIAEAVLAVLLHWRDSQCGTYHMVNSGRTSWHGFAVNIIEEYNRIQIAQGLPPLKASTDHVEAIASSEYPTPACRPANSWLDCSKLERDFAVTLPAWQSALVRELQTLG